VQFAKAPLPGGEFEFDGQTLHVELVEAPTAVEYVPAAQSEQAAFPVNTLYFPATHAVHGAPTGPVDPALQVQSVKSALPAGELEFDGQTLHVELVEAPTVVEYVPATQSEQVAVAVDSLYFPATHAVHGPPFVPIDPALQVQFALPADELEFDGQALHVMLDEAPNSVE
jgi:hypothetical protein